MKTIDLQNFLNSLETLRNSEKKNSKALLDEIEKEFVNSSSISEKWLQEKVSVINNFNTTKIHEYYFPFNEVLPQKLSLALSNASTQAILIRKLKEFCDFYVVNGEVKKNRNKTLEECKLCISIEERVK